MSILERVLGRRKHGEVQELPGERLFIQVVMESQVAADRLIAVVEEVNDTAENLTSIADESTKQEQMLREHSQVTKHRIESAFSAMREVAVSAERIRDSSSQMAAESEETHDLVLDAVRALNAADHFIQELRRQQELMNNVILDLQSQTSHIESINTFLSGIASQTSLLALNASIEAAHAGEHGRGFSIVAQEIKKLAAQSQSAVKNSSEMLSRIGSGVNEVVQAVSSEKRAVLDTVSEIDKIKNSIDHIFERTIEVHRRVKVTTDMSMEQAVTASQSIDSLRHVVDTVDLTMASVDNTLIQMQRQRRRIARLQQVGLSLERVSGELVQSVQTLGEHQAQEVDDSLIVEARGLLGELVKRQDLRALQTEVHEAVLSGIMLKTSHVEAIWSNDADGNFIYSLPAAGLLNARRRDWWKRAMQGELYVSSSYISSITKKPCVTLSTAIKDERGNRIGVIGLDIGIATPSGD